jgi:hypothetical protein
MATLFLSVFLFFFLRYWGLTQGLLLEPLHKPIFLMGFFKVRAVNYFSLAAFFNTSRL